MPMIIKNKRHMVTVEELESGGWIATFWDMQNEYQADREIRTFETFGGACEQALVFLAKAAGFNTSYDYEDF